MINSKILIHSCKLNNPTIFKKSKLAPPSSTTTVKFYLHINAPVITIQLYNMWLYKTHRGYFSAFWVFFIVDKTFYDKTFISISLRKWDFQMTFTYNGVFPCFYIAELLLICMSVKVGHAWEKEEGAGGEIWSEIKLN